MTAGVILYRAIAVIVDLALILLALTAVSYLLHRVLKRLTRRRKDREWFAWIASKPRGAEALEWYRGGPEAWRLGCLRTAVPVADAELEQWEREEIGRMEMFYELDGVSPYEKRRTTGGLS